MISVVVDIGVLGAHLLFYNSSKYGISKRHRTKTTACVVTALAAKMMFNWQPSVTFTAVRHNAISPGEMIHFDLVLANDGAGFKNPYFEAPFGGTYEFEVDFLSAIEEDLLWVELVRNSKVVLKRHLSEASCGQNFRIKMAVHLARGDRVWLQTNGEASVVGRDQIFSGKLIHVDTSLLVPGTDEIEDDIKLSIKQALIREKMRGEVASRIREAVAHQIEEELAERVRNAVAQQIEEKLQQEIEAGDFQPGQGRERIANRPAVEERPETKLPLEERPDKPLIEQLPAKPETPEQQHEESVPNEGDETMD